MFLFRMMRCAEAWEWLYMAVLAVLVGLTVFSGSLGLPRMVVAALMVPMVAMAIGALFLLDAIRRRAEEPWL